MAKINTTNYQPVTSWNGTQDLLIVEQPDGTKVATPAQLKQYVEAGDFEATGEVIDGHGNILKDMAKSVDVSTIKIGTFTKDSAQSGAYVSLSIRQVGKVVSIQGYISGLVVGNTIIGKISGVDLPPIPLRALCNSTRQAWETGDAVYTLVDTDGTVASQITKPVLNISITYII